MLLLGHRSQFVIQYHLMETYFVSCIHSDNYRMLLHFSQRPSTFMSHLLRLQCPKSRLQLYLEYLIGITLISQTWKLMHVVVDTDNPDTQAVLFYFCLKSAWNGLGCSNKLSQGMDGIRAYLLFTPHSAGLVTLLHLWPSLYGM